MNILRVYTNETDRTKVEKATAKILGNLLPQPKSLSKRVEHFFLKILGDAYTNKCKCFSVRRKTTCRRNLLKTKKLSVSELSENQK